MLGQLRILSFAAAALLAVPAFAAWPLDRAAQAERIDDQRIIREIVIDGSLTEAGSDEAPANELRPSWVDDRSVLDQPYQHSWREAVFFPVFWTIYIPIVTIMLVSSSSLADVCFHADCVL